MLYGLQQLMNIHIEYYEYWMYSRGTTGEWDDDVPLLNHLDGYVVITKSSRAGAATVIGMPVI
jgi:hypothetical protein